LCYQKGRFLFEVRPDIFPEGYLTFTELDLWGRYYDDLNRKRKKGTNGRP